MCGDRAIRRCPYSSSFLVHTILRHPTREDPPGFRRLALQEGRGSVLAVLARELRVRQAFCLCELVSPSSLRAP